MILARRPALALLGYLVLAFALFASAWVDPTYRSIGVAGDPQLFMWLLAWTPYAGSHGLNPLFTDFLIYPQGANLMWTLIPVVPGLLLAPVMATLGPVFTYNLAMTLGVALSAWCAYLALNALMKDRAGAFLGGVVYGFSPYMLAHALGHPNLVMCFTPPLVLLILMEALVWQRRPAWQPGVALGLLAAVQLLTTPEILFTTAIVGGVGTVVLAAMRWSEVTRRLRHALTTLAISLAAFLPVAAFPVWFLFFGPQVVRGVVREQDFYVTDLLNFVVPTHVMLVAPDFLVAASRSWTGGDGEWNGYVGVFLLGLLAFITVRWWTSLIIRWAAVLAAIVALLSLGPHLHLAGRVHFHVPLPWILLQRLPVFDNVLPARLMMFFYLLAGLAIAFFVRELKGTRRMHLAGWAWLVVSVILLLPAAPWPSAPNPVPEFFTGSPVQRIPAGSVALVAPFSTAPGFQLGPGQESATLPMLWQLDSGMRYRMPEGSLIVPDVNGAPSGGRPPQSTTQTAMIAIQQGGGAPDLTPDLRSRLHQDLVRWHVETVIVGPMYNQAQMLIFFERLLGRAPQAVEGVLVWWETGST